jgi:hypothetical protein
LGVLEALRVIERPDETSPGSATLNRWEPGTIRPGYALGIVLDDRNGRVMAGSNPRATAPREDDGFHAPLRIADRT